MSRPLAITLGTVLFFFLCFPFSFSATGPQLACAQTAAPLRSLEAKPQISFKGGPGDTLESAVVITGAANAIAGIDAETKYLEKKFGRQNRDLQLQRKSTLQQDDNYYDRLVIVLKGGRKKTIFFNITEFFGKL